MFALIGRNVIVHIAQFVFYHSKAFVNEHGGADGNLVLVLHPVFVIDGYEGAQHVFCTLSGDIPER